MTEKQILQQAIIGYQHALDMGGDLNHILIKTVSVKVDCYISDRWKK